MQNPLVMHKGSNFILNHLLLASDNQLDSSTFPDIKAILLIKEGPQKRIDAVAALLDRCVYYGLCSDFVVLVLRAIMQKIQEEAKCFGIETKIR